GANPNDPIQRGPVPANMVDEVAKAREQLIERVIELDDEMMTRYLEGEEISEDEIRATLRKATINSTLIPVLCGSALKNKGVRPLLDMPAINGTDPRTEEPLERHPSPDEPFAALAFKIAADPFVGKLAFIRVYSGVLKSGSYVFNATKGQRERVGRLLHMHANH